MKIQTIVNGSITMVIEPENPMEEEILKVLIKQSNKIYEVRTPITVLGKTIRGSALISSDLGSESLFIPTTDKKSLEIENL